MSDQAMKAEPWYGRRLRCDHVCLLERDHNGAHVYGYSLPPDEDRARSIAATARALLEAVQAADVTHHHFVRGDAAGTVDARGCTGCESQRAAEALRSVLEGEK